MLKFRHHAGFFSSCNVKLRDILKYYNEHKILPAALDSTELFIWYRPDHLKNSDITDHFFEIRDIPILPFCETIRVTRDIKEDQYSDYRLLNFETLAPFLRTYFSPSSEIQEIQQQLLIKYKIDPSNCIGVYYRGTDKQKETRLGDFIKYSEQLSNLQQDGQPIILQTDSADFLEYMKQRHPSILILEENRVSKTQTGIHNESSHSTNYRDIKYLFATFLLLAQCNQLITSSGNCSLWIMYYRGHSRNIYQCVDNVFFS